MPQLTIAVRGDYLLLPSGFLGMADSSEEDKRRLCGNPRDQQESARRYGQHQERAEMMIVTLTAKGTSFFFHAKRVYSAGAEDSQIWS
jgi:hypothetical protein